MTTVQLTVKNYRCFLEPVTVEINKGLTAFVGVNNAGKSALLRFLLELRPLFSTLAYPNQSFANSFRVGEGFNLAHVGDREEIFPNSNEHNVEFWIDLLRERAPNSMQPSRLHVILSRSGQFVARVTTDKLLSFSGPSGFNQANILADAGEQKCDMLELFEVFRTLSDTLYIGPFRNAINIGGSSTYFDISVGQQFIKQFRDRKTGMSRRQNIEIIELVETIRRLFEFESLTVEPSADDTTLHIAINNKPYKQNELGSGLIQFILVLANASIARRRLILIDEPELNLHPRLQLDFLTTLLGYATEGVWFATHSLGLARSAAGLVYSVIRKRQSDSSIRLLEATPRLTEFLGEMSFSSHQEIGFDKVLLVEGPTEVLVVQHILRKMGKDHKVVLLPLHGHFPEADELVELGRITTIAKLAALIDSERTSASEPLRVDRQRFLDLCAAYGIPAVALRRRATENYFTDVVVKRVFGAEFRALEPYERFDDVQPHWSKAQNWKAAAGMDLSDIMATDLGEFLAAL